MSGVPTDPPLSLPSPTGPPPPGSRTVTTDDGVRLHVEVDAARRLVREAAPGRRQ